MSEKIEIDIRGGKAVIQTEGFIGPACKDVTAQMQKAMGMTEQDDETPEFRVREVRTINN